MKRKIALSALLASLLAITSACGDNGGTDSDVSDESGMTQLDSFSNRASWIDHMGSIPESCIYKKDALHGDYTLFHGCYDWHSSVHAHWALFRSGSSGAAKAAERFTEESINKVQAELSEDSSFEMPYGRAWLLRLVTEFEAWAPGSNSNLMRTLGDETASSILNYLSGAFIDVAATDYDNPSWAVAQLHSYYQTTGNSQGLAAVNQIISHSFVNATITFNEGVDSSPNYYFSPYWSWVYVIAKTQPPETVASIIKPESIPEMALTPVSAQSTAMAVHHLGMNWSRAWAIKALAKSMQNQAPDSAETLVKAYHRHVTAGLGRHSSYVGDYYSYDHWVPQFAIYAITD